MQRHTVIFSRATQEQLCCSGEDNSLFHNQYCPGNLLRLLILSNNKRCGDSLFCSSKWNRSYNMAIISVFVQWCHLSKAFAKLLFSCNLLYNNTTFTYSVLYFVIRKKSKRFSRASHTLLNRLVGFCIIISYLQKWNIFMQLEVEVSAIKMGELLYLVYKRMS